MTTQTTEEEVTTAPTDSASGVASFCGFIAIAIGSAILWGPGGLLLSVGIVLITCCAIDEIMDKATGARGGQ